MLHRSSTASHISSRTWIADQKPGSQSRSPSLGPLLDFYLSTSLLRSRLGDDATGYARSGAKKYRTRSRKKVSGRRFKTRSVGLVEAESFFCLAKYFFFLYRRIKFYFRSHRCCLFIVVAVDRWCPRFRLVIPSAWQASSSRSEAGSGHRSGSFRCRRGQWPRWLLCVCVCVCVCVCHNEKRVPDEWQARQATQAILQVSSSKHNAKKITTRVRGPFHQSITAILTEEKREEKQFTKPTHVAVYLFRDLDRDRSRL